MISARDLKENLIELKSNIHQAMDHLNFSQKEKEIKSLEQTIQQKDIWQTNPQEAEKAQSRLNSLKKEKNAWLNLAHEVDELFLLIKELESPESEKGQKISPEEAKLLEEAEREYHAFLKKYQELEFEVYLKKKYDKRNAFVLIYAGAGGTDAQNWAKMLLRMYEKYCERKNFTTKLIDIAPTDENGIKSASLEVKGKYAYGLLKNEAGVHRLIRISPYSAQSLRHTSFALVEVLPVLDKIDTDNFYLNPQDLKIDTFKSSGPGGQNVNRRETAIRITHIPTGISVSSQQERSQAQNKEKALKLLTAKIIHLLEQRNLEKIEALKEKVSPEWGNQIRTYVLHPYKQVRDHRTKIELSNVEKVLDGDLDGLIEANLKTRASL